MKEIGTICTIKGITRAGCAAFAALLALMLFACAPKEEAEPAYSPAPATNAPVTEAFEEEILFPSRGVMVPAVVCMPETRAGERAPFAVMIHGHGAERDQGGGFRYLADALSERGVASIRFDCPGCGESSEGFEKNCLSSIKADALSAIAYMENAYSCDPGAVGLIGYSMGGRASLELVAEGSVSPYAMLLIAPAASSEDLIRLFGGSEKWLSMKAEAERYGSGEYFTGVSYQGLGREFFADIERIENPAADAAKVFTGRAAVAYAEDDFVVSPEVSQGVADALSCRALVFETGGHACGLYGSREGRIMKALINAACGLFAP